MAAKTQRHAASIAACGLLLLLASINTSVAARRTDVRSPADPEACALLKTEEVSKALGVTSLAGARLVASSAKECIWSDDPEHGMDHRRVTLTITSMAGFQFAKSAVNKQITVETASGIGDEAYYELFRADSPFLVVRKGNTAFSVRVLNGGKLKAFTLEEEKTKEADLAKAAVSRI